MGDIARFGVSLEQELLDDFDELCRKRGCANRSEALRHCIRRELKEEALANPQGRCAGVLTLIYDHHDSDLPRRLTSMQHEAHSLVLSTLHVHLDSHHCLEIMTLKGMGGEVRPLADRLRSAKGVLQSALALTTLENMDDAAPAREHPRHEHESFSTLKKVRHA